MKVFLSLFQRCACDECWGLYISSNELSHASPWDTKAFRFISYMRTHGRQSPNALLLLQKSCEFDKMKSISPSFPYLFPLDPSLLPKCSDGISPVGIEPLRCGFSWPHSRMRRAYLLGTPVLDECGTMEEGPEDVTREARIKLLYCAAFVWSA